MLFSCCCNILILYSEHKFYYDQLKKCQYYNFNGLIINYLLANYLLFHCRGSNLFTSSISDLIGFAHHNII